MKKRLTIFLLTAAIIAFNGCENSFTELNSRNFPKGYGAVRVSVDGKTDTAADWRTVFPTEPKEDSIKYEYKFYTVREGESLSEVPAEDIIQSDNEFILPAGSYIVEVEASVGEDEGVTFAKGSANFTITEGTETDTVAVNLSYIDDNGKGTFKIDEIILEEEGFSYELIKLTKIEDETVIIDLMYEEERADGIVVSSEFEDFMYGNIYYYSMKTYTAAEVPAGYYWLDFTVTVDDTSISKREVVHIYSGLTTEIGIEYINEILQSYLAIFNGLDWEDYF